jgi:hypothetical protein
MKRQSLKAFTGKKNVENGTLSSWWHGGAKLCVRTGILDLFDLLDLLVFPGILPNQSYRTHLVLVNAI